MAWTRKSSGGKVHGAARLKNIQLVQVAVRAWQRIDAKNRRNIPGTEIREDTVGLRCTREMLRVKDAGCSSAIVLQGSRESLQFYPTGELATDTLRPDKPGSSLLTSVWGSDTLRRALGLGPWGVR